MIRVLLFVVLCAAITQPGRAIDLVLQEIGSVSPPVAMTHAGDQRLFITQQTGRIFIHDGLVILPTPFLDISHRTIGQNESGLLSVAFHPQYSSNGFFYVNYTNLVGDTVIARYSRSAGNPNLANPNSEAILLVIDQPFANHNGGQLQFGPDGYLYVGMGDGGSGGDPENHGQRPDSLLGKILRIDVDNGTPYAIPPTNPFASSTSVRQEIWAFGLRNPWRFTFDRLTGDMFIGDVGQNSWEEVSFQPANSTGGENYGWRIMEGTHCFNPSTGCDRFGLVVPIIEYANAGDECSVTGGYRYRGSGYPQMRGVYFYGDLCSGKIWGAVPNPNPGARWRVEMLLDSDLTISTFGEDFFGELYVADYNGIIYQMTDTSPRRRRRAIHR